MYLFSVVFVLNPYFLFLGYFFHLAGIIESIMIIKKIDARIKTKELGCIYAWLVQSKFDKFILLKRQNKTRSLFKPAWSY